ncbi:MAG: polyprenyl synthetase family protein [Proteobacteria bacterium]|nr:polyprenyl synthetase family protein [Pseudomonadota bacterium]MBU1612590.1 polyprenyl synthetase family protein [Pseudomonadota bacterium]
MNIKEQLAKRAVEVESYLQQCLRDRNIPSRLLEAMEYSLLAGGKRLRPALVMAFARMHGADPEASMPFAAGLELIHTYSLIHDDLPAMDDDDLRRGRPSNHKQFDEATAILAGDGLLTEAFGLMLDAAMEKGLPVRNVLQATSMVAKSAGAAGMVGGQAVDMEFTGRGNVALDELRRMHAMKTGALISASCVGGAILAGARVEDVQAAADYGRNIGVAFQIVDDILDVVGTEAELGKPVGSDEQQGKTTYPTLLGLDESRQLAQGYVDAAVKALAFCEGEDAEFLRELALYIVKRAS